MKPRPLFITFEGGEGSGKSTQVELFYNWFQKNYGPSEKTREPGGVEVSEHIRKILVDSKYNLDSLTELFLFEAARIEFVKGKVKPSLKSGKSIICDRFFDSTTAYQGYAGGIYLDLVQSLNSLASQNYSPDLTFIIDIAPEQGLSNAKKRGELSRFDAKELEYHQDVNQGFRKIAEQNPKRCILIPYREGIEKVHKNILNEFCKKYKINP